MIAANAAYLAEMIARGNYDFVNRCLREGELEIPEGFVLGSSPRIFGFEEDILGAAVIAHMAPSGHEPAMFWDILHHGANIPEDDFHNLVALGSSLDICGEPYSPCIARRGVRRELHLFASNTHWFAPAHFLGVIRPRPAPPA